MSLNKRRQLKRVAIMVCRDLRKRQTKAENIFWQEVRNRKFCGLKFYRQIPIFHDLTGRETFFIADFFCYEAKLVIELDGEIHKYQLKYDAERTKILNALGLSVIRFSNAEIENNLDEVLKMLKKIIYMKGNEKC